VKLLLPQDSPRGHFPRLLHRMPCWLSFLIKNRRMKRDAKIL
jgi:hypothetical protein